MEKESMFSRFKKAINVFRNKDPTYSYGNYVGGSSIDMSRSRYNYGTDRTIVSAIYTRMSVDAASMNVRHVRVDENDRFVENVDSYLNECISKSANIDQTGRALIQDTVLTMLENGSAVVFPSESDNRIVDGNSPDEIKALRVGVVKEWYPQLVKIEAYNELIGQRDELILPKSKVAIVQNPFYMIMNTPNSTIQRLIRKLNLLDFIDSQNSSNKLDLIIQLPYKTTTKFQQDQAAIRQETIEQQLTKSKYGIAYIDSTEHITQLNRAVENNLLPQIEYLTKMVHGQLGITPEILSGTANEQEMKNYMERTISPIMVALTEEMQRKFISKNAETRGQSIMAFNDPFRMVPTSQIAEMADKLTRNEIMTSNEIRKIFGIKPSDDPNADVLRNKNLNQQGGEPASDKGFNVSNEVADPDNEPLLREDEYQKAISDINNLDEQLYEMSQSLDDTLEHYASKYYDPVKAHEYYERTKKLKGRKSTSDLNEEGKEVAKYVKEQVDSEKNKAIDTETEATNKEIETIKIGVQRRSSQEQQQAQSQILAYNKRTQRKIDLLQSRISMAGVSDAHKAYLQSEISKLRTDNAEQKAKIQLMYKTTVSELKTSSKSDIAALRSELKASKANIKSEYDEKYLSELDKIKADSKYAKASKSSSATQPSGPPKLSAEERKERRSAIEARNNKKITADEADRRFEAAKKKYRKS